jgi:crossover junction endodeoxyribonuclease RusA
MSLIRRRPDPVLGAFFAPAEPLTVELPWFNAALAPNRANGRAWGGLAATKSKAKADACALMQNAAKGRKLSALEKYPLCIMFIAPDNRRRDLDGCHGAIKHYLDGVALALGIDDSQFRPIRLDYQVGAKPGKVVIEVGA